MTSHGPCFRCNESAGFWSNKTELWFCGCSLDIEGLSEKEIETINHFKEFYTAFEPKKKTIKKRDTSEVPPKIMKKLKTGRWRGITKTDSYGVKWLVGIQRKSNGEEMWLDKSFKLDIKKEK